MRRIATAVVFLLIAGVGLPARGMAESADDAYLRPGRLVDIGGYRLNIVCRGHGAPTVVFDAGLEDWSPAWSKVQPVIARSTRACSYDRAGNGRSDAGPLPRDSASIVTELHELLGAAGEKPPYILVGHSFGGENVRLFADRYLDEVAGIVLVDSSHEDQLPVLESTMPGLAAGLRRDLTDLRVCRARAAANQIAQSPRVRRTCQGIFFRGLPEPAFSPALNAVVLRATLLPRQYAASLGEAELFGTASAAEVRRARRSFGSVPLRILTGTRHFRETPATNAAERRRDQGYERAWQSLQRSFLGLSSNARDTLAERSGHYVQLDQPQLVIAAIREEIGLARVPVRP